VGLKSQEGVEARRLSDGQRRRVALARLIACRRQLWLLDEVGASLDADAELMLETFIEGHLADGGMVVAATHQQRPLGVRLARCIQLAA
jgi:heme exporter protein A